MKKFSDYKGDDAIELWADLVEPIALIMGDKKVAAAFSSGKPKISLVRDILKGHKKEVSAILLRIDDTPLDGINLATRVLDLLLEVESNPDLAAFLELPGQKTGDESSGSPTESTGEDET